MPARELSSISGDTLFSFYAALRHAVNRHGVAGALGKALQKAAAWRHELRAPAEPDAFDAAFGTDTAGIVPLWTLGAVEGPHRDHGVRYQPCDPVQLGRCLAGLPIDPARYSFVDLGSGKGRTLLIASRLPFRRVIGVEFAAELHAVAEQNLRRSPIGDQRCGAVESVCADAAAFDLPLTNLVRNRSGLSREAA